jgi:UDP-3-O-[3-hydroxymyristoyl] glucosamine N-acyltransferase
VSAAGVRQLSAGEVAVLTGGRLVGPPTPVVTGVAPLDRAGPSDLSFLAVARYLPYFQRTRASIVLLRREHAEAVGPAPARVVVDDPHAALLAVLPALYPQAAWEPGIHPTAVIGRGAQWDGPVAIGPQVVLGDGVRLGRNVRVGAGCVLGAGVVVGDDAELHVHVVCYPGVVLGARVMVHAGVVLGADGFGYARRGGRPDHHKIPHVGRVLIGDDVEIGANTSVDRGSIDDTVIGPGTKIDSLVQIGHNVHIGARCLIMAQVGIAGSTRIDDDVIVAGQAGIVDHRVIGSGARVGGKSGVTADVPAGGAVLGYPARERREWLRAQAALYRLTKIVAELERIAKRPP